eukprot:1189089-Prorocentrum_minimum.AAC.1
MLPARALQLAGLDLSEGPSKHLRPSHGHVCAFISLDAPHDAFDLKGAGQFRGSRVGRAIWGWGAFVSHWTPHLA